VQLTIEIPDELAERLEPRKAQLAQIIERGLAESASETSGLAQEVVDFLARGPQPEAIVAFSPSESSAARARELLDKNRAGTLSPDEHAELEEMSRLNHLFALIKAHAHRHLRHAS
jgi:hypothetical protein